MLNNPKITQKGLQLLGKVQSSGVKLVFTDMRLGDGIRDPSEIQNATSMISTKLSKKIEDIYNDENNNTYFRTVFSNESLDKGFYVREIGIFAIDPDEGEILYEYTCSGSDDVDYFTPGKGAVIIQETIDIVANISNTDNVQLTIDPSVITVTKKEFNEVLELLPKTYVSETEPENWKAGDTWHKVLRTRIVPDATEIYAQMLETMPYDPQRLYSIETDGTKETVTNLESEEYTIKEI